MVIFLNIQWKRAEIQLLVSCFECLNCHVFSGSDGTTHNACALALHQTHTHIFTSKHTPLILTLKHHSQACGAESSSQNAGSLGEEIIRICATTNCQIYTNSRMSKIKYLSSDQTHGQSPSKVIGYKQNGQSSILSICNVVYSFVI